MKTTQRLTSCLIHTITFCGSSAACAADEWLKEIDSGRGIVAVHRAQKPGRDDAGNAGAQAQLRRRGTRVAL